MADSTVSGLTAKTTLAGTDILYLVQSPFGSGDDRKVAFSDLVASALTAPTMTGNTVVSSGSFGLSGNITRTAWTTSGARYANVAATLTDTSSSGTVATAYTDLFGGNTIAASSATTFTNYYTAWFGAATAGSNVTFTNKWAMGLGGALQIAGGTVNGTVLDISQTWGSTGTYTGISYDVTDSGPANAASLLVNFMVGGSSKFSINKAGTVTFSNGVAFSNASGADMGTNSIMRIGSLQLGPGSDAIITRATNATFQLGAADAASPVAQTLRVQSSSSTNNNGVDWTIIGSKSAGSGTSGNIIFKTGATGAASGTTNTTVTALTITPATTNNTNTGYPSVVVGAGAAVATNATDGFLYIPTCAGTPTGTPTTQTGAAPLVVDSSNNKLYVFVGGAWTAMN